MNQDLTLRIILETPPSGVDFALQKGSGHVYETIQTQRSASNDLQFDLEVKIKNIDQNSEEPNFIGPFVQGAAPDKFIYIDIGTYAGQRDSIWGRRLKIPLQGITIEMINVTVSDPDNLLVAKVAGTGKDGGPNCATVKPFNGWHLFRVPG